MRKLFLVFLVALIALPSIVWTPSTHAARARSAQTVSVSKPPRAKINKRDGMLELSISVRGGAKPLTFEWFQRTPGATSTAVGTNDDGIEISPVAGDAYYWVRITDANQVVTDSPETLVTYVPDTLSIYRDPKGRVNNRTGLLSLVVSARGGIAPYTYNWYQGAVGDTSTAVGSDAASIEISPVDGFTLYWVQITDSAGSSVDSKSVGITYTAQNMTVKSQPRTKMNRQSGLLELSVSVSGGIAPFTYDWYVGTVGDTSTPITTTATSSVSISPVAGNTSYWVRITDSVGTVTDSAATSYDFTVQSLIIKKIKSKLEKRSGQLELEVDVSGGIAPYTYDWFQGAVDDESTPVGTNHDEVTVAAPAGTTTFWVKVTDSASTIIKSNAISSNFTPAALSIRSARGQIDDRGMVKLEVNARGGAVPYTYAWYNGNTGDTLTPIGTDSNEIRISGVSGTETYWVQVTDRTGASVDSQTITINFTPLDLTISESEIDVNDDGVVKLKVEVKGGLFPYTYEWFQGAVDDESTPVGTDSRKIELPITPGNMTYWVKVTDAASTVVKSDALADTYVPSALIIKESEIELDDNGQIVAKVEVKGGVAPYTYAWFAGAVDDESTPVGTDAPRLMVDVDPGTATYWVKVTDRDGTVVKSDALSTEFTPEALAITKVKSKVNKRGTLKVEVDVTGGAEPYTYAWFQGAVDDESTPVGQNHEELNVPADSGTTTYWVKVTDRLGTIVKSDAIGVAFTPSALTIKKMSRGRTLPLQTGKSVKIELEAEARGGAPSYTYTWYAGSSGDTSTEVGTDHEIKLTKTTIGTYTYWVRITDRLGATYDSPAVTFEVINGGSNSDDDD